MTERVNYRILARAFCIDEDVDSEIQKFINAPIELLVNRERTLGDPWVSTILISADNDEEALSKLDEHIERLSFGEAAGTKIVFRQVRIKSTEEIHELGSPFIHQVQASEDNPTLDEIGQDNAQWWKAYQEDEKARSLAMANDPPALDYEGYSEPLQKALETLKGSLVVDVGHVPCSEGGLAIIFRRPREVTDRRLVIGYNDLGAWLELLADETPNQKEDQNCG